MFMSKHQRTVFATLLAHHRDRLNLTQADVAGRTVTLHADGIAPRAITERTISALERLTPGKSRVPHQATVRSLAMALELEPGTPAFDALLDAARNPAATPTPASDEPDAIFLSAGREPHLARLTSAIDAAANGSPSIVLLTGEAGSGKTRLLEEIGRRALNRRDDTVVLWGTCPRGFGAMTDHEPWRQVLARMLRDPTGDGGPLPDSNGPRLDSRLPLAASALTGPGARLVGTLTSSAALQRAHVLDSLGPDTRRRIETAPAPPAGKNVTPGSIGAALIHVLARYASASPVVIVLEDLHWADDASRSTLHHIASSLATQRLPIVVLGSVRTGDPATESESTMLVNGITAHFPDAVLDLSSSVRGEAGRAFVNAAVARLGKDALADRLFERTGGMPLYVMSFLRLQAVDATAISGNGMPVEIDAVFARQLAHLDPRSRALLAAASVQSDDFLAEPALEAVGIPSSECARYLDDRLAGQVRFVGRHQVAPGIAMHRYRFAHALLHDHVTGTLSRLERSHLHLATADALERRLGLRYHHALDLSASQVEQGGDLRRAGAAWRAAGDRAMQRSDYRHARAIFRHVREMGIAQVAAATHVQAQVGIGNSLRSLARPDQAREALLKARREANREQLHTIDANALLSLGVLDFDAGRMAAGAARFADAIDDYARAGEVVEASRANASLSLALHAMGRYDEARARAEEGVALGKQAESIGAVASAEISLANCWLDLGYYERAIASYEAGLARNDKHGLIHYGNICILNIALCRFELGHWDAAEAMLDRLDEPERRLVDRMRSVAAFNGALIMEARGDLIAARHRYEASRRIRHQLGQVPLLIDSLAGLLRIAIATDDRATAGDLLAELESRLHARGTVGAEHLGRLYLTMIEAHHKRGNAERALRWLSDAVALLRLRAERLADPDHRKSYLTRPSAHRRIIALARAHQLPVPGV